MSKAFFNKIADKWDEKTNHNHSKIKEVINSLKDFNKPHILDVGTGTGVLIPYLKKRYGQKTKITAIDFAANMIRKAQEKFQDYDQITYVIGDIYTYTLPIKDYDLIICYSVFPHFDEQKKLLAKLKTLLKNQGHLVIFHSQSRQAINNLHKNKGKEVKSNNLPPAKELVLMAEKLGFKKEKFIDNQKLYFVDLVLY